MLASTPHETRSVFPTGDRRDAAPDSSLTAQQTTLVRAVLEGPEQLSKSPPRDPATGRKVVTPLTPHELERFGAEWSDDPIGCIRAMNRAIRFVEEQRRMARYVEAAFDLELLMDRRAEAPGALTGVPAYLADGYTDLGIQTSLHPGSRRQKILVDKERLRPDLIGAKKRAIEELGRDGRSPSANLETTLRAMALSLRKSVGYDESRPVGQNSETTVRLSESVGERSVSSRHLAILYQLRLQESGISSQLVKGKLHLYSLKLKHVWNVVTVNEHRLIALVDVAFGEDDDPFVLTGSDQGEVYEGAARRHRTYSASPDALHRYELRRA